MGFWSKLGGIAKFAVPAILAATGVGIPAAAAITAGTNLAGSKMQGKSWKGSLIDGMIGAGTGALGGVAANAAKGAAGAAGAAGSTAAGGGMKGTLARVGGSMLEGLLNPNTLQDASRGIGAVAATTAKNRGVELDAMMEADQMRILQDRARREDETHMMPMMQRLNYIKAGGAKPSGPQMSASGRPITQFSFGGMPITEGDKQMATTLEGQLMRRLAAPPSLRDYDSRMKPGTGENIMNWAAPALGVASSIFKNMPKPSPTPIPETPPITFDENKDWAEGLYQPKKPTSLF